MYFLFWACFQFSCHFWVVLNNISLARLVKGTHKFVCKCGKHGELLELFQQWDPFPPYLNDDPTTGLTRLDTTGSLAQRNFLVDWCANFSPRLNPYSLIPFAGVRRVWWSRLGETWVVTHTGWGPSGVPGREDHRVGTACGPVQLTSKHYPLAGTGEYQPGLKFLRTLLDNPHHGSYFFAALSKLFVEGETNNQI